MHYNVSYISEENLKKLTENTAHHMEEHKTTIKKLTGENITLKNKEDIFNRDIKGIFAHTN